MDSHSCAKIFESLKNGSVSRVKFVGEAGTGKTWMARKIFEHASKERFCFIALWLNLNKDLDETSLYEDIASQLSVFLDNKDDEEDDSDDESDSEDEADQKVQDFMRLKEKIHQKLRRKKLNGKGNKGLLLVLDDEGSVTTEKMVMRDLYLGVFLAAYGPLKILLTRRDGEIQSHALNGPGSLTLRVSFTDEYLVDLLGSLIKDESLAELHFLNAWGTTHELLRQHIMRMSMRLPAALVVIAKSLNHICQNPSFLVSQHSPEVLKKVNSFSFQSDTDTACEGARENPVLRLSYELLETSGTMTMVDCFWHSLSFFEHCGCVSYQELIGHWILEGYFDPVRSVTKAYKDGHDIMMELIRRGFLKIQEGDVVMPEATMKSLIDLRRRGLSGRCRIGLAKVCGSDMTKGLGKINQVDDIIEAVRVTRRGEKLTTVLVSGNRLRRENPRKFFGKLKDLEMLGLFEPKLEPFIPFLLNLVKLRVLVIRDCDLLTDIEELQALGGLHALEVSGASSLKKISDGFFKALSELQSLHLSGLQIKSSPSSISQLMELHRLIIRDCPLLEDLPDIQELVKLEVVDVSGARGLQTCFDNTLGEKKNLGKNKNFYYLTKLQLLDFSESQIERLPIFQDSSVGNKLPSVTRLLLRNCSKLRRLPSLRPLSGLQVLDLSGTTSLVKMLGACFEDKKDLRILSMSRTNLRQLPSTIEELSNLSELLLRDCTNLEALPNIGKLTNLKVFDVSGCAKLHRIEGSFVDMSYLREIDLSGTQVMIPPEFPKESKSRCLKSIILTDKRLFKGEKWSQITEAMQSEISQNTSSCDAVVESHGISETEYGEITEIQSNVPRSSYSRGISGRHFHQVPLNRALYKKTLSFLYSASQQEATEVNETNGLGEESLANAEFLSFVDCSDAKFTSIFNKIKSLKGCWLRMSLDIRDLFSGVDEERLGSLETLSITNLPSLETICCGGSFKNLKKLSVDCCPKIRTLFPEAAQVPSSLEVLHIKFCEKLENVLEGLELSTLTNLTWKVENCPNFKDYLEGWDWVIVDGSEASP
ncbi:unnamed protein product [Thlaspi arvense]|uniref:NB-ARC domain-containing protein n=1 Tax=Thlaspi arvense TaxID=13288 RepID=A0AAU9RSS5_THLAR|nr:unnamed protein product [Thlaspi arvense]